MLPILTLQRHEKAVHALAVWQDSVFTGSEDMEIKVCKSHFSRIFSENSIQWKVIFILHQSPLVVTLSAIHLSERIVYLRDPMIQPGGLISLLYLRCSGTSSCD